MAIILNTVDLQNRIKYGSKKHWEDAEVADALNARTGKYFSKNKSSKYEDGVVKAAINNMLVTLLPVYVPVNFCVPK
jgi:hypothetical protein